MRERQILSGVALGVIAFSLLSFVLQLGILWMITQPPGVISGTGLATSSSVGRIDICINQQPDIIFPCNVTLTQNQTYYCQVNFTDPDNDSFVVNRTFITADEFFNISSNGTINFVPINSDVGNHTVNFTVDDGGNCENSIDTLTVDLEVLNVNDAPVLIQVIPDQSLETNTTLSAFFLTDYFIDPDNDTMNFTNSIPANVDVTILPSSEVRFTSQVCVNPGELVVFTATDPYNASASSNAVTVTITCTPPPPPPDDGLGEAEASSGGGGGGGGCIPDWDCQEWFPCLPVGEQWLRCYDTAACASDRYLTKICEYTGPPIVCEENWLCEEWGNCYVNGTQHRSCEDLTSCGTEIIKPPTSQECVYIPTCNDGLQNGEEEGIDCGGACAVCPIEEKPAPFEEVASYTWLLWVLIVLLLIGGTAKYYQTEIAKGLVRLGFMMRKETFKEVLLNKEQRNRIFERILRFEERILSGDPNDIYDDMGMIVREYVQEALDLPIEALPEEVALRCVDLKLQEETSFIINKLFDKLEIVEQEELIFDEQFVQYTAEEIRTLVCLTSEYEQPEIERQLEELTPTEDMSFYDELFIRMTNALRAVQFGQHDVARKEYVKLLEIYDPLPEAERDEVYPELQWSFTTIKFASEVAGTKMVEH